MSESKIRQDKNIKNNTGAVINAASCGENPSSNVFTIGYSKFGKCSRSENSVPIIDLNSLTNGYNTSISYNDGDGLVNLFSNAIITDYNDNRLTNIRYTIASILDADDERLSINSTLIGLGSNDSGTLTINGEIFSFNYVQSSGLLTFTKSTPGEFSIANAVALIRSTKYENVAGSVSAGTRTISVVVNDGSQDSNIASGTLTVTALSTAPATFRMSHISAGRPYITFLSPVDADTDAARRLHIHTFSDAEV